MNKMMFITVVSNKKLNNILLLCLLQDCTKYVCRNLWYFWCKLTWASRKFL